MNITSAQDYCSALLSTSRRAWQQWECAERKMHPAMWELVRLKIIEPKNDGVKETLILTKEEAFEVIRLLQEQLEIGVDEFKLVVKC